ncbi:MAG: diaminopimelate epimerase [Firmicutes bacterium]|nr:diaminopimelate epimerase [Bacillota bacterium]
MHGLGNNYVYVNLFAESVEEDQLPSLAMRVANVNTGIGSDGLITIGPSHLADVRMRIFNADGSEGQTCGNGLRCVGRYVFEKGILQRERLTVETQGGLMNLELHLEETRTAVDEVTVDMGLPRLRRKDLPVLGGAEDETALADAITVGTEALTFTGVSMGNPHAVIFVQDVQAVDVAGIGPLIERDPLFPERVNVEFVAVRSFAELDFRVWERGSGITQACGTGACAAVVASVLTGRTRRGVPMVVHLPGGDLNIRWDEDGHVYMRGPASWIAEGELAAEFLTGRLRG